MPIVRMRVTPWALAPATSSASGAGPRSRWVWESITARASLLGFREELGHLLDARAARAVAEAGGLEPGALVAERGQQLLRRLGDVGPQQDRHGAKAFGEAAQRLVELVRVGLVLGELPRGALLDVAVQTPDALPDPLQRLRDLRVVEQVPDFVDETVEVGREPGVDLDVGDLPVAVAGDHRQRAARQVAELVR